MRPTPSLLTVGLMAGLALAGCLAEEKPTAYEAAATGGWFVLGWGYDGHGVAEFNGTAYLAANDEDDTGLFVATGRLAGKTWVIVFDRFAEQAGKPFQDGGIASSLDEHGASGVGDTSIPQVYVDVAAWGLATVTVDGALLEDPVTGNDTWVAHYMVIRTGVRDDLTHGIYQDVTKSAPYDPTNASKGYADPKDDEVHLVLRPHAQPPPNATEIAPVSSGTINDPMYAESHPIENTLAGSAANLTVSVSGSPTLEATDLTFTARNPSGVQLDFCRVNLQVNPNAACSLDFPMGLLGAYTVGVSGRAVNANYQITGTVTPPSAVVMNFWWEDVMFGGAAASLAPTVITDATGDTGGNGTAPAP